DIAFAAVLGSAFGPGPGLAPGSGRERGVYRTKDGGKTWDQVLKKTLDKKFRGFVPRAPNTSFRFLKTVDIVEHVGAIDVCFDPNNPRILFAALWQARRTPWDLTSGGPGSGLYRSDDGGDTWKHVGPDGKNEDGDDNGLPAGVWGRVGVAVAPS